MLARMDRGDDDDPPVMPVEGMTISVRSRQDVVIVDPQRFLAAARRAYRQLYPDVTEEAAAEAITDVYDAVHTLLDRYGELASDDPEVAAGATPIRRISGGVGLMPGERVRDRPDGLSPAGTIGEIVLDEPHPLQDYGCFFPEDRDLFAVPPGRRRPREDPEAG
jgi:hypothetical protein